MTEVVVDAMLEAKKGMEENSQEGTMVIGGIDVEEENESSADDDADELEASEDRVHHETDSTGDASANYESANDSGNGEANGADGESPNLPPQLTYQPPIYNARNAGRKKSNPVWEFFEDLRSKGLPGVRCKFCGWSSNDRSPTTMKFHLRRKHDTGPDGPWASCAEKIASTPTQQYTKRNRGTHHLQVESILQSPSNSPSPIGLRLTNSLVSLVGRANGAASSSNGYQGNYYSPPTMVQQHSQQAALSSLVQQAVMAHEAPQRHPLLSDHYSNRNHSAPHRDNIPPQLFRQTQVVSVNVSAQPGYPAIKTELGDGPANGSSGSPAHSSSNHHGPNHETALRSSLLSSSNTFSLADGQSIAQLLQVAADMDLTFTFNARRSGEYCFEANGGQGVPAGKMVVIADLGTELRVSERIGPEEVDVEMWLKADWQQFLWAVRGKCHKALKSPSK